MEDRLEEIRGRFCLWGSDSIGGLDITWMIAEIDSLRAEVAYNYHLSRARALDADCYCVSHACDRKDCAEQHDDND